MKWPITMDHREPGYPAEEAAPGSRPGMFDSSPPPPPAYNYMQAPPPPYPGNNLNVANLVEQKREKFIQCGFRTTIVDIVISVVWIGVAIVGGVFGPGWPYAAVLMVLYAGNLTGDILILTMKDKKKLNSLLFWLIWTGVRCLGEIITFIVFFAISTSNGQLNLDKSKGRGSSSGSKTTKEEDRVHTIFIVFVLFVAVSLIVYVFMLIPMSRYYRALKPLSAQA